MYYFNWSNYKELQNRLVSADNADTAALPVLASTVEDK
jgi:hypothetical protein